MSTFTATGRMTIDEEIYHATEELKDLLILMGAIEEQLKGKKEQTAVAHRNLVASQILEKIYSTFKEGNGEEWKKAKEETMQCKQLYKDALDSQNLTELWLDNINFELGHLKWQLKCLGNPSESIEEKKEEKIEEKKMRKRLRNNLVVVFRHDDRRIECKLPVEKAGNTFHIDITTMLDAMSGECQLLQCYQIWKELFKRQDMTVSEDIKTVSVKADKFTNICKKIKQVIANMQKLLSQQCSLNCIHGQCDWDAITRCRHTEIFNLPADDELLSCDWW